VRKSRTFETQESRTPNEKLVDTLDYLESEDFNEYWDDSFGEFSMGELSYPASEILFNVDKQAYVTEYNIFNDLENEKEGKVGLQEQEPVQVEHSNELQEVEEPILAEKLNEFPQQEKAVELESPSKDLKSEGKQLIGHSSKNQQELNVLQKLIRWILSLFNK
jgi:t-SNARE complex subunit (syntaxin)